MEVVQQVQQSCGLIKDLKTRYSLYYKIIIFACCGLIKDLKTRYLKGVDGAMGKCCGLIKDLKTRYYIHTIE